MKFCKPPKNLNSRFIIYYSGGFLVVARSGYLCKTRACIYGRVFEENSVSKPKACDELRRGISPRALRNCYRFIPTYALRAIFGTAIAALSILAAEISFNETARRTRNFALEPARAAELRRIFKRK